MKNKVTHLLLVFLLLNSFNVFSQYLHHYVGKINNKYPITLNLFFTKNIISGTMYYNNVGIYIDISGSVSGNKVKMKGTTPKGKLSDIFEGKIVENNIVGKWINPKNSKTYNFSVSEVDTECVAVKSYNFERKDSIKVGKEYATFSYENNGYYPVATPHKGYEKVLLKKIFEVPDTLDFLQFLKLYVDTLHDDWKEFGVEEADSDESVFTMSYDYSTETDIAYDKNCIFSLSFTHSEYTGGAHGFAFSAFYNFDVAKNKELLYSDVFSVDSSVFVNKFILPKLEHDVYENCGDSLQNMLLSDSVGFPDYWLIMEGGIDFIYNVYSILPYACGDYEVFISYDRLKGYLKHDFLKRIGKL